MSGVWIGCVLGMMAWAVGDDGGLDDFGGSESFTRLERWTPQDRWLSNPSPTASAARDGQALSFRVAEPRKGMKWSAALAPIAPAETPYLVVRYRAENVDTANSDYFIYVDDQTPGRQLAALRLSDVRADGQWHLVAVDLTTLTRAEAIRTVAIQVQAGSRGGARAWLDRLGFTDTPPEGAAILPRAAAAPAQPDWVAPLADASWTAQPGWLANPADQGEHSLGRQGGVTAFRVARPASGMKWSWQLAAPLSLEGHRYVAMRYRARGYGPHSDYALCALGKPRDQGLGYVAAVGSAEILSDGRWHNLALDVRPVAPQLPTLTSLAIQVQAAAPDAVLELADLRLTNQLQPDRLADALDWSPGAKLDHFQPIPLGQSARAESRPWRRRLRLADWFVAPEVTVQGVPFVILAEGKTGDLAATPLGGRSELRLPASVRASEVYLLMLAVFTGAEEPAYGSGKLRAIRDVDRFRLRLEYADGTADECLPMNVATKGFGIVQGPQVVVAAADGSKPLAALVLEDRCKQAAFAIVAATARTGGGRLFPEAMEETPPLRVRPSSGNAARGPGAEPPGSLEAAGPPLLRKLIHRATAWNLLAAPAPLVKLQVDGKSVALEDLVPILRAVHFDTSPKRKRGQQLIPSLALRASVKGASSNRERHTGANELSQKPRPLTPDPDHFVVPAARGEGGSGATSKQGTGVDFRWYKVRSVADLWVGLSLKQEGNHSLLITARVENCGAKEHRVVLVAPSIGPYRLADRAEEAWYLVPKRGTAFDNRPCSYRERYCGLFPVQFLDTFSPNEGRGLCLRTLDTDCLWKHYLMEKKENQLTVGVEYAATLGPGGSLQTAPAVITLTDGDWHAGLDAYRRWLAEWYRPLGPRKPWFREVFNFRQRFLWGLDPLYDSKRGAIDLQRAVDEARREFGGIDYLHLFDWGACGPYGRIYGRTGDYSPYDYLRGGRDALASAIAAVQGQGVPVGLYIEGYLLEERGKLGQQSGKAWQLVGQDGKGRYWPACTEMYACSFVPEWREVQASTYATKVKELNTDGMYLDEYGFAGTWVDCWSKAHGHPAPGYAVVGERDGTRLVRQRIDRAKPGVALYTEETPVDVTTQYQDGSFTYAMSTALHTQTRAPLNLARFALPSFKTIEILYCDKPTGSWATGVKWVFFNGEAIWLEGEATEWFEPQTREAIRACYRILRKHRDALTTLEPIPLVPTEQGGVFANAFPISGKTLYTLYNARHRTVRGELLRISHRPGATYYDEWRQRPAAVRIEGSDALVALEIGPHDVGCVVAAE